MIDEVTERLNELRTGSVVLSLDAHKRPINAAIKDAEGSWALGGHKEPWPTEKLVRGLRVAKADLTVLYEAAA